MRILLACATGVASIACSSPQRPAPHAEEETAPLDAGPAKLVADGDALLLVGGDESFSEAIRMFRSACDGRYALGCTALGYLVRDGLTGEPLQAAFDWFAKGCELGDAAGCGAAGNHLLLGERDEARGHELLRRSCDKGNGRGCVALSGALIALDPVASSAAAKRAGEILSASCPTSGLHCGHLADAFRSGIGVEQNLERARELYEEGCQKDDGRSCVVAGQFFVVGVGVAESPVAARARFAKACSLGFADGCNFEGLLAGDAPEGLAMQKFERACQLASGRGCFLLSSGRFGSRAVALRRKACQYRYAPGCVAAGVEALTGVPNEVVADEEAALRFFDAACVDLKHTCEDSGCTVAVREACHNAAGMYGNGIGTAVDEATGKARYRVACDLGGIDDDCKRAN